MKKELIKVASELDNYLKKVNKINSDDNFSKKYKSQEIKKAEKNFLNYSDNIFNKINENLDRQVKKSKEKLQKLQGDDYSKKQYEYIKAVNEMSNYENPADYLKDKKEVAESDVELQEARKVALNKARTTGQAEYEQLKEVIIDTMSQEEKEARKELAKVEIKRNNLKSAKNSFEYDFNRGETNLDMIRTYLIEFSSEDNIEQKATKKIPDTIK